MPDLGLNCRFQAVSELEPAFLGGMALQAIRDYKSFCFCMLHRPGAAFCQPELQYFTENVRVSAIFASRRQSWGAGSSPWRKTEDAKKGDSQPISFRRSADSKMDWRGGNWWQSPFFARAHSCHGLLGRFGDGARTLLGAGRAIVARQPGLNTVQLTIARRVLGEWHVPLFRGINERPPHRALPRRSRHPLVFPRPVRGFSLRFRTQGSASLHPWATIRRRFAAQRLF